MALQLENYTFAGQKYPEAYAKVDNITYDNTTKIAQFDLCIYNNATDMIFIKRIHSQLVKVVPGTDMIEQAYNKIKFLIQNTLTSISNYESYIASTQDEELKLKYEKAIANTKATDYFTISQYTSLL